MKKSILYAVLFILLLIASSCSEDDMQGGEKDADILVENSPWQFESFELSTIVKKENDTITEKWVQTSVNEAYENLAFTFNEDGTGFTTFPDEEPFNWSWYFSGNDTICFDAVCDEESFTKVELTENSFRFELIAGSPRDADGKITIYIGNYLFK